MVDLIKRRPASLWGDHEAAQLMHRENDFWAAKIHNMDWLLSAPRFHQVIVSVSGDMAQMNTVDPRAFILFKEYMAMQDDRDPLKKPRDYAQAQALRQLINERLPQYTMTHQPYFPKRLQ
jgi:hypothetical protein